MPLGWDVSRAIGRLAVRPWAGDVWRSHGLDPAASRRAGRRVHYEPTSDGGSRKRSGRYHRARDLFPTGRVWPALYTSLTDGGCIAEALRYTGSLADLDTLRVTRLHVELANVLDMTDPVSYGLTKADVIDERDYTVTQEIGLAALERGADGILVPPASLIGTNLVILTDNLAASAIVEAVESIDPRLYVRRVP